MLLYDVIFCYLFAIFCSIDIAIGKLLDHIEKLLDLVKDSPDFVDHSKAMKERTLQ